MLFFHKNVEIVYLFELITNFLIFEPLQKLLIYLIIQNQFEL